MMTLPIEPAPAAPADARPTPVRRRQRMLSGVNIGDRLYQVVLTGLALTPPLLLLTLLAELAVSAWPAIKRSEEHTSELQSHSDLVCRLLLEKKKKTRSETITVAKNDDRT